MVWRCVLTYGIITLITGEAMKKFLLVLVVVGIAVALSGCGLKAPSEKELEAMIPQEILTYYLDGDEYSSSVSQFEITRRQTNEKDDYAECDIVLTDNYFVRYIKIAFYTKYYDVGGWQLESWNVLERSTTEVKVEYNLGTLKDYIESQGYMLDSDITVDSSPGSMYYVGNIFAEEHKYLTCSGQIAANVMLDINDSSRTVPMSYTWNIQIFPQIEYEWNVLGTWYGEPYHVIDGTAYPAYVTLTIKELNNQYCSGIIEAKFDSTEGGFGSYGIINNTNKDVKIQGNTIADISLSTIMYAGYDNYSMIFYPDEAYIAHGSGTYTTWSGTYSTWVPLTRQ